MDIEKVMRRIDNIQKAEEIAKWLEEKRKACKMKIAEVSRRTGIYYGHLYRILAGEIKPTLDTILRIAEALGCRDEALERWAGMKPAKKVEEKPVIYAVSAPTAHLPVVASVPCGKPIEVEGSVLGFLPVHQDEAQRADFAIRAEGDSMSPYILHGDFLLVRRQETATPGDIVVVSFETDGGWETTVKKYVVRNGKPYLEPLNPAYPTIPLQGNVRIVGRVVQLKRFL